MNFSASFVNFMHCNRQVLLETLQSICYNSGAMNFFAVYGENVNRRVRHADRTQCVLE